MHPRAVYRAAPPCTSIVGCGRSPGVRARIAGAVAVGVVGVAAGIARLALLGWLLARVPRAQDPAPSCRSSWTVAITALRGWLEYARTMLAHVTAARVQARLRGRLYDKMVALGPALVRRRSHRRRHRCRWSRACSSSRLLRPVPAAALRGRR